MSDPAPDPPPEAEPMVTTAKTKDFLGRALVNPATAGVDFLARSVKAGDLDYLNRALV